MKKIKLLEVPEGIEGTRREQIMWYPLHEVLFIMPVAVICGAASYVKAEMFGKSRENQKTLYRDVRLYFEEYRKNPVVRPAAPQEFSLLRSPFLWAFSGGGGGCSCNCDCWACPPGRAADALRGRRQLSFPPWYPSRHGQAASLSFPL